MLLGIAVFLWVRERFEEPAAGLFAAVLVVFVPWRLQYLTNLNNLTLHFAIFGAWLLSRWLRTRSLAALIGSVLCFQVQLVTSTQVAIVSIYLVCIWIGVVWVVSGIKIDRTRCAQILAAGALFAALSLPWWYFFREAIEAAAGFPRTGSTGGPHTPRPLDRRCRWLCDADRRVPAPMGDAWAMALAVRDPPLRASLVPETP